jgi:hypothetical protein
MKFHPYIWTTGTPFANRTRLNTKSVRRIFDLGYIGPWFITTFTESQDPSSRIWLLFPAVFVPTLSLCHSHTDVVIVIVIVIVIIIVVVIVVVIVVLVIVIIVVLFKY